MLTMKTSNETLLQTCKRCHEEKSICDFNKDSYQKNGLNKYCKVCAELNRKEHIDRVKTDSLKFKRHGLKKGTLEYKEYIENYRLKSSYGITTEDYNKIFNKQEGCCAICKVHQSNFKRSLYVDHDHTTNEVRGLLCSNCNTAIGLFKENINTLKNSILYLENTNK